MYKNVAFDIGNVLFEVDLNIFTEKLAKIAKIRDHDAYFFLSFLQPMQDIGITTVAYHLEYKYNLSGADLEELLESWNATVKPNRMMLDFLEEIKQDSNVALLSNMGQEHLAYIKKLEPQLFESSKYRYTFPHISCEVGARKPTKLFFQAFNQDWDLSQTLYVDDLQENLDAGVKYCDLCPYRFDLKEFLTFPKHVQETELDRLRTTILE